ncbi:hypothetical protein [Sphingomonas sp.]|uniref:hypothetical protein n=1 Tax=Sphingomonas sp. TaxID=28214 RepID=UPI003B00FDA7
MDAVSFVGLFYNFLDSQSYLFNKTPDGRNGLGATIQTVLGNQRNLGVRAREELSLTPILQLVAGFGAERSIIEVRQTNYTYPVGASPTLTLIPALRRFNNVAPEASLVWQADPTVRLHARVCTAYGVPHRPAFCDAGEGAGERRGPEDAEEHRRRDWGRAGDRPDAHSRADRLL